MVTHRISLYTAVLLLFLFTACGGGEQDHPAVDPGTPLSLEENLVIRSGSEGGEVPFLSFIHELAVDHDGNIYVYNGSEGINEIYKYDDGGNYVLTIGGQGRGPGEHHNITAMYADSENRLITADRQNARITVFSPGGQVLGNEPPPGLNTVVQIREMPDGRYILVGWHEERQRLVHLARRDFTQIVTSMGRVEDVSPWYEDEIEKRFLTNQAGRVAVVGERGIIFIPSTYPGKLHFYSIAEDGYEWERAIEGYESIDPPLVFGSRDDPPGRTDAMLMMRGGRTVIIMQHSVSFGMYPLKDGSYLHVSYRFPEGEPDTGSEEEGNSGGADGQDNRLGAQLVMERFSADLDLLQFTVTDTLNLGTIQRKRPLWVDRSGQLYLADNSGDSGSVVRRFQIEGLGLD